MGYRILKPEMNRIAYTPTSTALQELLDEVPAEFDSALRGASASKRPSFD
jgi:hypothetical protein